MAHGSRSSSRIDCSQRTGRSFIPQADIPGATWIGEYFGDVMLVNGKVWPFLEVEPRMYRLRILNGCNARILSLDIGGPSLCRSAPRAGCGTSRCPAAKAGARAAERADVLVDFSKLAGSRPRT